ncbi:hypothetical protein BCR39DRAFT_252279 [Naematelia encephala]|uniref:TRAF-type domain-containing protein n=1 Tax=Naematelia encephala TaxID=71784 RepID=A0A1Y2AVY9_9TREE|nr:hypothetical protein BCR39DRAFT_252279 [Naematelia encephala]
MARRRLSHHRAYECFQRKMECRKCGVLLRFRDQTAHLRPECEDQSELCDLCDEPLGASKHLHGWSCPLAHVPCTHSSRGCPSLIARKDLDTHLASCPFEAMSSFFTMNDARFKALEERNDALESEVGRLRAELRDVRGNVSVARMSLGSLWRRDVDGPWARNLQVPRPTRDDPVPEEPNENNTTLPQDLAGSSPSTLPSSDSQPSSVNNQPSLVDSQPSRLIPSLTPRAALDFSAVLRSRPFSSISTSTTPSEASDVSEFLRSGQLSSSSYSHRLAAPTSSFGQHSSSSSSTSTSSSSSPSQSHAEYAFSRLSLSTGPGAATQGLDEILNGLRAVVVNLAAGLDTMERRNEARTMTESLRVLERVESLRAVVSTMRMRELFYHFQPCQCRTVQKIAILHFFNVVPY